jgi:hypothetical protein
MSSSKRADVGAASSLDNAGILLHVLSILGPGHHLFISGVSKAWRESYERVANIEMAIPTLYYSARAVTRLITSKTTLYSAVLSSASTVNLAHKCGLHLDTTQLQRIAGRVADVPALRAAHELGLQFTRVVLIGAAEAASIPRLQWLHTEQGCLLPSNISLYAARSGSIDTLRWLMEHGSDFTIDTCRGAAAGAHLHVLHFLRDEGCEWDEEICIAAAGNGEVTTLQWLHEQGCPWEDDQVCGEAAKSGNIESLLYLKQQGCDFNEFTMTCAAAEGQ